MQLLCALMCAKAERECSETPSHKGSHDGAREHPWIQAARLSDGYRVTV